MPSVCNLIHVVLIHVVRLVGGIGCCLVAILLAAGAASEEASDLERRLPRFYVGVFEWDHMPGLQTVQIRISTTRQQGAQVEATGCGRYDAGGTVTSIGIRMVVDVPSLDIEIWESDPDRTAFTTDGSHKGKLSADLQTIDAEWTTVATGQRGRLELRASGTAQCGNQVARLGP